MQRRLPFAQPASNNAIPLAHSLTAFLMAVVVGAQRFAHCEWLRADRVLHALLGDSGFQGYAAGAAHVWTPHKKPRGRALPWQHRRKNRKLARARVPVEHALASVKRLGILRQPLRARRAGLADTVMLVGCGLHNFRLDQTPPATN